MLWFGEFDTELASNAFELADWLGVAVTGDECYPNETLAVHGPPQEGER
jgi:CYTH domain-containing protein